MAPRQPRGEGSSPDQFGVPGGGSASSGQVADIYQRLGGIERSITYIEAEIGDLKARVQKVSGDVGEAKATFNTLKFLFIGLFTGTWGLISALVIVWAKHHFGW